MERKATNRRGGQTPRDPAGAATLVRTLRLTRSEAADIDEFAGADFSSFVRDAAKREIARRKALKARREK